MKQFLGSIDYEEEQETHPESAQANHMDQFPGSYRSHLLGKMDYDRQRAHFAKEL